jgi:hypothetical protein
MKSGSLQVLDQRPEVFAKRNLQAGIRSTDGHLNLSAALSELQVDGRGVGSGDADRDLLRRGGAQGSGSAGRVQLSCARGGFGRGRMVHRSLRSGAGRLRGRLVKRKGQKASLRTGIAAGGGGAYGQNLICFLLRVRG